MFLVDAIELLNKEELRTKEVTSEFPRTLPPLSFRHWAKDEISRLKQFQLKRPSSRMQVVGISKLKVSDSKT